MMSLARMMTFGAALIVFGATAATAQTMVKKIDVSVDLTAISNVAAAEHFMMLDTDLQSALTTRLANRIADDGVNISVDLSEIELSNFFEEAYDTAETVLVGQVNVSNENQNTDFRSYELAIRVSDVTPIAGAEATGETLAESSDEYYDAMIAAFADAVVARLDD